MRALAILAALGCYFAMAVATGQEATEEGKKKMAGQDRTIESVLKRHTDRLMSLPGVVGTAIGECSGQECIKVFVVKKDPDLVKKIPAKIDSFSVVVQETGEIRALEPK